MKPRAHREPRKNPRPPQTSEMVLSAVRELAGAAAAETAASSGSPAVQGARPRDVVRYIRREYNVRAAWVKRDVNNALRWGVEYGLLTKPQWGVYLPAPASPAELSQQARRESMLRRAVEGFREAGLLARLNHIGMNPDPNHDDAADEPTFGDDEADEPTFGDDEADEPHPDEEGNC
ncbi:uncharacterized protein LOC127749326 isoform X2 [Frankliniella occidentalis]|uniref:Uncharacterized protein LOC127749326 isoform X2 n=1 Tax=Frankliniella occidentalis TaxID=133901 RepID=A0A9C6U4S6_FRAOC|nr:uncharacterized protein LOC127749326 isoform X2 [Frankliniella occidentalis]